MTQQRESLHPMPKLLQAAATSGPLRASTYTIALHSEKAPEFMDITDSVRSAVRESGVAIGFAVVYSKHTTAAIKVNEWEPLLLQDMERFLGRIAAPDDNYLHNDFTILTVNMNEDECPNGHAHCQHLVLSTSETLPIVGGRPQLGQYQRVFMVELDRPRAREAIVVVLGV